MFLRHSVMAARLTLYSAQALHYLYRQGKPRTQDPRVQRRQPPRHSSGTRFRDGGSLWRILRLQHLPRHRDGSGSIRQDARARRRRKRHVGPCFWLDRDESTRMPGHNDQGTGRVEGEAAEHDTEFAGQRLQLVAGCKWNGIDDANTHECVHMSQWSAVSAAGILKREKDLPGGKIRHCQMQRHVNVEYHNRR